MKLITLLLTVILLLFYCPSLSTAGNALSFDGGDDYVSLDFRAMNGLTDCTVEYWVYIIRDGVAASPISCAGNNTDNEYLHFFDFSQNGFGFRFYLKSENPGEGPEFPTGEWFHFALSRAEDGHWTAYINGEQVTEGDFAGGALVIADRGLILGQEQDNVGGGFNADQALHGRMDELRIWDVIRSEEQIQSRMNSLVSVDAEGLVAYYRFDEGEGQVLNDLTANEYHGRLGAQDGADNADPRWIESEALIYGGIVELDANFIAFGPVPQGNSHDIEFNLINNAEVDDQWHNIDFTITDLGDDPDWLTIQPEQETVEVGDSVVVTFTASAENLDPGEYERAVRLEMNASNLQVLEMPVTMIVVEGSGRLFGRVTDEGTHDPVENALVQVAADFDLHRITDEDGRYEFANIPAFSYDLIVTSDDHLPLHVNDIAIENDDDIELNFELLHGEFFPNMNRILRSLGPDEELDIALNIENRGNGPLAWSVEKIFPEEFEADPWELRAEIAVQELLDDDLINGVAVVDGLFYISGGNRRQDINKVYIVDSEGEAMGGFDQFHESDYGMRDLTWDGELIWGADENNVIYGFNTDGELIDSIAGDAESYRSLAWDPVARVFWSAYVTSNVFATDLQGNVVGEIEIPGEIRIYGLSYWNEDPDGYNLYLFSRGVENNSIRVYHVNLDDGDIRIVADIELMGRPGGINITNQYDPYSWVLTGIVQNDDILAVWHLASFTDWLAVDPIEGAIEASRSQDISVTLNSAGLREDTEYTADLLFDHDGWDGSFEISVILTITGPGGLAQRTLSFNTGWNLVSLNIYPEPDSLHQLLAELVEDDLLILMKDGYGNFYVPEWNFNNIEIWRGLQGYQLKVTQRCEQLVSGEVIPWDTTINLHDGWNMISYLPHDPIDAIVALSGIEENLLIAKDGNGMFYLPEWNFSNMGSMREGRGYQVKVDGDVELVYNLGGDRQAARGYRYSRADIAWLNELPKSADSYSLLLLTEGLSAGTRLEACTLGGIPVGRGIVDSEDRCGIAIWQDETGPLEGGLSSPPPYEEEQLIISITLIGAQQAGPYAIEWLDGSQDTRIAGGWGVARMAGGVVPYDFGIESVYPNPFNGQLRINFTLDREGLVSLLAYDLSGRKISEITSIEYKTGSHEVTWNASQLPSGIFYIVLESQSRRQVKKVLLIK